MALFEIRFLKDICNDTGHQACVLQRVVSIEAPDAGRARDEACTLFCAHEKVGRWQDHADRVDVVEVGILVKPGRRKN